mmetsp:Transcript_18717/g.17836  ORF Transcript_18717/g.17836 Transcript_18717/m.17836 type:complete len:91 (+) Transcript_18717:328-600(+)
MSDKHVYRKEKVRNLKKQVSSMEETHKEQIAKVQSSKAIPGKKKVLVMKPVLDEQGNIVGEEEVIEYVTDEENENQEDESEKEENIEELE